MATPTSNNRKLVFALVVLLLLAGGVAVGVLLGTGGPATNVVANTAGPVAAPQPGPQPAPANDPPAEPATETAPTPEPPPPLALPDVSLEVMTRFRYLVREADTALELADPQTMNPEAAARRMWLHAVLEAMKSHYVVYSEGMARGDIRADELSRLRTEAGNAFLRPDVPSATYTRQDAPRVSLWLRQGVKLPATEPAAPPGTNVPLARRLHEEVSPLLATQWLESMEAEFGKTNFGAGPDNLPLDIVVFPAQREYLEFAARRLKLPVPVWSAGFYSTAWDVACAPISENVSLAEVLRHEMFHALQSRLAPHSLMVPWFGEGTAEWLDKSAPVQGKPRTHPEFCAAAWGYLASLVDQGLEINLREFMKLDVAAFYARPELNYLLAYCWVDFLRTEDDLRPVYFDYWRLMVGGAPADNAWDRTFGALDMASVQARFLARLRAARRQSTPPRFTFDGSPEHAAAMPAQLDGSSALPEAGKVSGRWFEMLGRLSSAGIDTSRTPFLEGDFDVLVIAIDNTESMSGPMRPDFDFAAFGRWIYSMRFAGTLNVTRRMEGGTTTEAVPAAFRMALVEAVLTGKLDEFREIVGLTIGKELVQDIEKGWQESGLHGAAFEAGSKRELCREVAEAMGLYWTANKDGGRVAVVDFHQKVVTQSEASRTTQSGWNTVRRLFEATAAANPPKEGLQGADTDWHAALKAMVEAAQAGGRKAACLFFTDGPNSFGMYGHLEAGRDNDQYMQNQKYVARDLNEAWQAAGFGSMGSTSRLMVFALPGAEDQCLDEIPKACPQATLDNWWPRFRK